MKDGVVMKKIFSIIIALSLTAGMCNFTFAEDEEVEEKVTYATGALIPTEEEIGQFKENTPMIVDVKPNSLFYERLNEELGTSDDGIAGGQGNVAEDGNEIISSWDNKASLMSLAEEAQIPSAADNSGQFAFPMIEDQRDVNSCVGWSLAYYQLTNNANKIRNKSAKDGRFKKSANVYSPTWVYNLGNKTDVEGMSVTEALSILYSYGCPTIEKVPIIATHLRKSELHPNPTLPPSDYLDWFTNSSAWENAMYNKCDVYYGNINPDNKDTPITNAKSPYLNTLKRLIADGYVVSIFTFVDSAAQTYLPITKTGYSPGYSQSYVWTEVRTVPYMGHVVTIVGYDDNYRVDINENGRYENGEYGAFKIANSWGDNAYKHKKGYVWLAYDALNKVSPLSKRQDPGRTPAFVDNLYYFVKPQKDYKPLLSASVGMTTSNRGDIDVTIGIEDVENPYNYYEQSVAKSYEVSLDGEEPFSSGINVAFKNGKGAFGFDGESKDTSGNVVFDMTSLLKNFELKANHNYNLYVKLQDPNQSTSLDSFVLKDINTGESVSADGLPLSTKNQSTVKATVAYVSSIMSTKGDKALTLTFNSKLNESTVNDMNFSVSKSNGDDIQIDIELDESEEKVRISPRISALNNDFYKLSISEYLKSKGGNGLSDKLSVPFYVPFH